MAGSSFFALFDDIASILDDVATMTKVATKKTAGVLGDDLALNAQQVTGVNADRELPVVWAVAKGSFVNKAILVPTALAISAFAPFAVVPLLMIGGAYLCFEGVEKLAHKWLHPGDDAAHQKELREALVDPQSDLLAIERDKIKGAVRTDFILSAEIITIALGTVADKPLAEQAAVLVAVGLIMNIGVYGLVAGIVKLDDMGLAMVRRGIGAGRALLWFAPYLMKTLSVLGTAAMFLVGGGIVAHGIGPVHHAIEHWAHEIEHVATVGPILATLAPAALNGVFGVLVGAAVLALVTPLQRLRRRAH